MVQPKKSLGQNFLRCDWVVDEIIRAAELTTEDTVLEIGPGTGVLTRALAKKAGRVIAVEKDEHLASELRIFLKKEGVQNVEIITGDILKILPNLFSSYNPPPTTYNLLPTIYKLVANIPYYLTGHLFRMIFEQEHLPKTIVLTIQKEVAERVASRPPHSNLLALSVQAFGTPEIIAVVPASCFFPQPKVDSAILKISDISGDFFRKNKVGKAVFFETARRGFSQKRKTLVNSLALLAGGDKSAIAQVLLAVGLDPRARPEELSLKQWTELIRSLPR
ncbi:MAG: ribosomal RNA small subunit methyltransferase A [Candidatus Sungbacteria bacterium]|nr:ribosomal RNA small subunit methyltransferase A [Candidatus Sungbacteria bacterium]